MEVGGGELSGGGGGKGGLMEGIKAVDEEGEERLCDS